MGNELVSVENNTSTEMVDTSWSGGTEVIRPLGAMERCMWLLDQVHPVHFSVAAEIEGPTTLASWRLALDAVQRRHPLLSVCIDGAEEQDLSFRRVRGARIPLRVIDDERTGWQWEREMETELSRSFDGGQAPLLRAVLVHQPNNSILILTSHHSIGDGLSLVYAIRDTLRALSGESLEPLSPQPSMETLVGGAEIRAAQSRGGATSGCGIKHAAPHIKGLRLSTESTGALLRRSRQEKTTVHGALCAALVLAGRQAGGWDTPVRIHSAIDARRIFQLGEDYMQLATSGIVAVDPNTLPGFWDIARFMQIGLIEARSRQGMIAGLDRLSDLLLQAMDAEAFVRVASQAFAHEATLTNLGNVPFATRFGNLKLTSLWGPAIDLDGRSAQTIGAATANGALCLLYTSSAPTPWLLEMMEQVLAGACKQA